MHYPASCAREWTLHWGGFCYFPWEVIPPCAISHCKEAFVVVFLFAEDKEKSCICVFMWFPSPTHQYYTCTIHKFSFSFLPLEMIAYWILPWKQQNACWPSSFSSKSKHKLPIFPSVDCSDLCLYALPLLRVSSIASFIECPLDISKADFFFYNFL